MRENAPNTARSQHELHQRTGFLGSNSTREGSIMNIAGIAQTGLNLAFQGLQQGFQLGAQVTSALHAGLGLSPLGGQSGQGGHGCQPDPDRCGNGGFDRQPPSCDDGRPVGPPKGEGCEPRKPVWGDGDDCATGRRRGVTGPDGDVHGTSGDDTVHISRADGLAGQLGMYEVNVNGECQLMTKDQLESTKFNLGDGNDKLTVDDDVCADITADGGKGHDVMVGGAGDDKFSGGKGNDVISGGRGNDKLDGGKGNDKIDGGCGDDVITGGKGNDCISGGGGNDKIDGGKGKDHIDGGCGNDKIDGGKGNDHIRGGRGNDCIDGGKGNDRIDGGRGNDHIHGGKGNDHIRGGPGNDRISGGPGNDRISGGPGNDKIDGGRGNDRISDLLHWVMHQTQAAHA